MHQNLENKSRCKIVTNREQFHRHVLDPKFLDVHVLTPTIAILSSQSLIVTRHTNIPCISSKIYQRSKFMMFRGFFYIAARLCAFSGDGGVRLAASDTGRDKLCNTFLLSITSCILDNKTATSTSLHSFHHLCSTMSVFFFLSFLSLSTRLIFHCLGERTIIS